MNGNRWVEEARAFGRARLNGASRPVVLYASDLLAIAGPIVVALPLLIHGDRYQNGHMRAAHLFGAAFAAFLFRLWGSTSTHWVPRVIGNFYIFLSILITYANLDPIIDIVSPGITYDASLAAMDQVILGVQASVWLERIARPWLTELLFYAYSSFYFWQLALGALLYRTDKKAFEAYRHIIVIGYMLSYVAYALVPAIGPRFTQTAMYQAPLEGVWLAGWLRDGFARSPMLRDCFPSGHTGITLLVMIHGWRSGARRFVALMAPVAVALIFSTLYCRFHYLTDLLCALPFVVGVLSVSAAVFQRLPSGLSLWAPVPSQVPANQRGRG